jgi:hypothetical protein
MRQIGTLASSVRDVHAKRAHASVQPLVLSSNVPGMESWTSVVGISDTLHHVVKAKVDRPVPISHEISTRKLAESAGKEAKLAVARVARLDRTKTDFAKNHQPLETVVEGIVTDLCDPDGMHNHLLTFSTGGTPVHPTMQHQANLMKPQKEVQTITMMKGFGTSDVDPSNPIFTKAQAAVLGLVSSIKTVKASLGGEAVQLENETFHSAEKMEVWVVENVGSDSGFPDVVSMLEAVQDSSKTSDEMLGLQAGSIKAGHKGLSASRMQIQFRVIIPQVLAKKGNGTEIYAASYEKRKSHDGQTGDVPGVVEVVPKSVKN